MGAEQNIMTEGVVVSIMGFLIVFTVLLVIMGILSLFNLMAKLNEERKQELAKKKQAKEEPKANVPAAPVQVPVQPADDLQLIAVITAAIAAHTGSATEGTDGLVVKSIRRVNTWNKEALSQQNNSY